jgi:hypothetical protein
MSGAVSPGAVMSSRMVAAIEVETPSSIARIVPVVTFCRGIEATDIGCGSHLSRTSSREEEAMISAPAAWAVS